jgi:hypothetical protein
MLHIENSHLRDDSISFQEIGHKYTINGETDYTSVTTFTHSIFSKFDAHAVIENMMSSESWSSSVYFGMTEGEIIRLWEDNRKDSAEKGTMLHKMIEDYYNDVEVDYTTMEEFVYFMEFDKDHCLTPYRTEWMIWDSVIKIAGSIDMVAKNSDGTFTIYDWKRSKRIYKDAFGGKHANIPGLSHIPDTNFWHYAFQLNVYKYILETSYGVSIRDMFIVQIHPTQSGYKKIKMPDLGREVDILILNRSNDLNNK